MNKLGSKQNWKIFGQKHGFAGETSSIHRPFPCSFISSLMVMVTPVTMVILIRISMIVVVVAIRVAMISITIVIVMVITIATKCNTA
jgi:hypothetical protein